MKLSVSEVVSGIKFKTRLSTKATRRNREIPTVKVELRSLGKLSMKLTLNLHPLLNQIPKGAPPQVARVVSPVGHLSWRAIRTLKITGETGASGEHKDAAC